LFSAAASALLIRSEPTRSGELLGKLGGAELAGISIGPLAGALALSVTNPQVIFGVSAVVVALGAIATFVWMREVVEVAEPTERPPAVSFDLLRSRFVIGAVLLQVAIMFPTGVYDAIWPRFMADIGSTNLLTAASYTLFAIPYVILAGWAGRLADRLGGAQAFTRGIIIVIVTMPLYALIPNPWAANGLGFLESTGQALAFGGAAAAMAHIVDPARAASGQGLGRAAGLVAATVASGFTGLVYATGGSLIVFAGSAVVVAVISIVALVLLRGARARRNAANSPMTQLPFVP
jgi:MFS family permease